MTVEAIAVGPGRVSDAEVLRFRDAHTGCVFTVTSPEVDPDLWHQYLAGALDVYRTYGVEHALEYDAVRDGQSTSKFFAAVDQSGRVVAGVRIQGPYLRGEEIGSLRAWGGSSGGSALRATVEGWIPFGMVEGRGAWVARDAKYRAGLSAAVSRCLANAPRMLGARYGFATVASFTTDRHRASGARAMAWIPPVAYPDDRYRTVPIWWDTQTYQSSADRAQYALMRRELLDLGFASNSGVGQHV